MRFERALALTLLLFVGPIACGDDTAGAELRAQIAEGCAINSDCNSPLVCAFRSCHVECQTTRDCASRGPTSRCVQGEKPYRVCQNEEEQQCVRHSECPGQQVCGVDGRCRDACVDDRDCGTSQQCISTTCAEPAELSGGKLVPKPETGAILSCERSSECPGALTCLDHVCKIECLGDKDCPLGAGCAEARCVLLTSGSAGTSGSGGSAGASGSGGSAGASAGAGGASGSAGSTGGTSAGSAGSAGATAPTCACVDPNDECDATLRCVKKGITCDGATSCGAGYACGADARCACTDEKLCGRGCRGGASCPTGLVCFPQTERCGLVHTPLRCLGNIACAAGEGCLDGVCKTLGPKATGAACAAHTECASGVCGGVCLSLCDAESDCTDGLRCGPAKALPGGAGVHPATLACMAQPPCPACTGSSVCQYPSSCLEPACTTTADCSTGGCYYHDYGSRCGQVSVTCQPNELVFDFTRCMIPKTCYPDDPTSCLAPYECTAAQLQGPLSALEQGVCSRKP